MRSVTNLPFDERVHAVEQIARGDRHVRAESQRVVLVDPRVVARLDAELRQLGEARTRQSWSVQPSGQ